MAEHTPQQEARELADVVRGALARGDLDWKHADAALERLLSLVEQLQARNEELNEDLRKAEDNEVRRALERDGWWLG